MPNSPPVRPAMRMRPPLLPHLLPHLLPLLLLLLMTAGCEDSRDERLAEMARQSTREQARQNERMAEQSRQMAADSRHLVEQDARARKALIETQANLQNSLHAERAGVDRQRETMERERRELAAQRQREPIIAAVLTDIGLTLACLLPLLLAGYVLYSVNHSGGEPEVLTELLQQLAVDCGRGFRFFC